MKKTILITGASSGIGRATAIELASPKVNLVLNSYKNSDALFETALLAGQKGADCLPVIGDVSDYSFCSGMVWKALERFERIDALVNAAGVAHISLFQDMQPAQWQRILSVNLGSVINLCHLTIPHMISRKSGRIINISSVWGNVGASCEAVYSTSKGGVNSFTKALAKELAPSGIQVNALACGAIDTPMNAELSEDELDALCDEIPEGRLGHPEEAARMIRMLLEAPDYLTGQVLTMDGGWT